MGKPMGWLYAGTSSYKFVGKSDSVDLYYCPYCDFPHYCGKGKQPRLDFCWRCAHDIDVSNNNGK